MGWGGGVVKDIKDLQEHHIHMGLQGFCGGKFYTFSFKDSWTCQKFNFSSAVTLPVVLRIRNKQCIFCFDHLGASTGEI